MSCTGFQSFCKDMESGARSLRGRRESPEAETTHEWSLDFWSVWQYEPRGTCGLSQSSWDTVSGVRDSWSWGPEFTCHVGCRDYWNKYLKKEKKYEGDRHLVHTLDENELKMGSRPQHTRCSCEISERSPRRKYLRLGGYSLYRKQKACMVEKNLINWTWSKLKIMLLKSVKEEKSSHILGENIRHRLVSGE